MTCVRWSCAKVYKVPLFIIIIIIIIIITIIIIIIIIIFFTKVPVWLFQG